MNKLGAISIDITMYTMLLITGLRVNVFSTPSRLASLTTGT
jgi:hypothetical protein